MRISSLVLGALAAVSAAPAADTVRINPLQGLPVCERVDLSLGQDSTRFEITRRWVGNGWASTLDSRLAVQGERVLWLDLEAKTHELLPAGDGWVSAHDEPLRLERDGSGYRLTEVAAGRTTWFDELGTPLVHQAPGLRLEFVAASYGFGSIIGPWGRLEIERDPSGRALSVQGPGTTLRYAFSGEALRGVEGPELKEAYAYEGGNLVQIGEASIRYDEQDRAISLTGGRVPQLVRYLEPEAGWRVHAKVVSGGELEELKLTSDGRMLVSRGPEGVRQTRYDRRFRLQEVRHNGRLLLRHTLDSLGRIAITQSAEGLTEFHYERGSRKPSAVVLPSGEEVRSIYDEAGRVTLREGPEGAERFVYDAWGRLIKRRNENGALTTLTRDASGNVIAIERNGVTTRFERDEAGRVHTVHTPDGRVLRYTQEGNQARVEDQRGVVEVEARDAAGRVIASQDRSGQSLRYDYDAMGLMTRVYDAEGDLMRWTYDAEGQLETITDAVGNVVRFERPEPGVVVRHDPSTGTTTYRYDAYGRLSEELRGELRIRYRYDDQGRLVERRTPEGVETLRYDVQGRLAEHSGPDGSLRYGYDAHGRVTSVTNSALEETLRFSYDAAGRRAGIELPWGTQAYERDVAGRLTAVVAPNGERVEFELNDDGRRAAIRYPNGVQTRFRYERENLTSIETLRGESLLDRRAYAYDEQGRIASCADTQGTVSYSYDARGRVISAQGVTSIDYAYDAQGNRVADATEGRERGLAIQAGNRVASVGKQRFHYDSRGALVRVSGGGVDTRYRYDVDGRLREVRNGDERVRYGYAPNGTRLWREDGKGRTRFLSDGLNVLGEGKGGAWTTRYVFGDRADDVLLAQRGERTYAYHYDTVRSVTALTDGRGRVAARYGYGPFGEDLGASGPAARWNRMRYTSRELDHATGLYDYRARAYDPGFGRFTSCDPLGLSGGSNLYAYVGNDPLRFNDPMGLSPDSLDADAEGPGWWDRFVDAADAAARRLPQKMRDDYFRAKGVGSFALDTVEAFLDFPNLEELEQMYDMAVELATDEKMREEFKAFVVQEGEAAMQEYLDAVANDPDLAREKEGYAAAFAGSMALGGVGVVKSLIKLPKLFRKFKEHLKEAAAAAAALARAKPSKPPTVGLIGRLLGRDGNGDRSSGGNRDRDRDGADRELDDFQKEAGFEDRDQLDAASEAIRNGQGRVTQRPSVEDQKLNNIINDMFKGESRTQGGNQIGSGSTADAARAELATGIQLFGKDHVQKARELIGRLERFERRQRNGAPDQRSSPADQEVARRLLDDLRDAVGD